MPVQTFPADFADNARQQTNRQLAQKYGVGEKVVTRWRKETGSSAAVRPVTGSQLPKPFVPAVSPGLAAEAAQHMRKTHRPVYHRVIEGAEFRGQYVVGTQILSDEELVTMAFEKGFRVF
jgi:hypothetical protein